MRVTLHLETLSRSIKTHYRKELTAALLAKIGTVAPEMAAAIHDGKIGCRLGNRLFKPFTHSGFVNLPASSGSNLIPLPPVVILEVGWDRQVLDTLLEGIKRDGGWDIAGAKMNTLAAQVADQTYTADRAILKTLSPAVVERPDRNQYIWPAEDPALYQEMLRRNLIAKHTARTGSEPGSEVKVHPTCVRPYVSFWGNIGLPVSDLSLVIEAEPQVITTALLMGVGQKNSMGFGMLGL